MKFSSSIIAAVILVTCASQLRAQTTLSNFDNLAAQAPTFSATWRAGTPESDQYVQDVAGFISIAPVAGGNPQDDGIFAVDFLAPISFAGLSAIQATARIDTGNASPSFTVALVSFNGANFGRAEADFSTADFTSSFSTEILPLNPDSFFDPTQVIGWQVEGGNAVAENAFRVSFDQIVAVPEPSVAALLSLGSLALFLTRRRGRS
jgi:hypothetical protein